MLTSTRRCCTSEDSRWCISDCMVHSWLSCIEWSRLLRASPVSCASTHPCRANIQSEIPHGALSSCLHPFWQNLHFLWLSAVYATRLPFRPLRPRFPFDWLLFSQARGATVSGTQQRFALNHRNQSIHACRHQTHQRSAESLLACWVKISSTRDSSVRGNMADGFSNIFYTNSQYWSFQFSKNTAWLILKT